MVHFFPKSLVSGSTEKFIEWFEKNAWEKYEFSGVNDTFG